MNVLIGKIKNGEIEPFKEVFYLYSHKLHGFLLSKTKSEYFANEVTQITFIKLWKYRERLNEDVKLSTQIFQIAKTTLIDELRKEGREKANIEKLCVTESLFRKTVTDGYEMISEQDTRMVLKRAIEQLPPIRKKVFQLSREEQLSNKEISQELYISVKTVEKHIQLALRSIKPIMSSILVIAIFVTVMF